MVLKPRIVASLAAAGDVPAIGDADMIEVRLDLVKGDPLEVLRAVRTATEKPIIATNRLQAEGGQWCGAEEERIGLLIEAAKLADWVDIELRARLREEVFEKVKKPIIVSYHDFDGMPSRVELEAILDEMKSTAAAISKIAVTPSAMKDNLAILEFLLEANIPLCMIAMGPLGRHLRAVAPLYGSVLTYGYVSQPTAPGQMSISELGQALRLLGLEIQKEG
jgi:3-dehydroquinate dehydratase-1